MAGSSERFTRVQIVGENFVDMYKEIPSDCETASCNVSELGLVPFFANCSSLSR